MGQPSGVEFLSEGLDVPPSEDEFNEWRRTMATYGRDIAALQAGHQSILSDLSSKHAQNRNDIHSFRNSLQAFGDKIDTKLDTINDLVTDLRIQNGRNSALAGIVTACAVKLIEHFVK